MLCSSHVWGRTPQARSAAILRGGAPPDASELEGFLADLSHVESDIAAAVGRLQHHAGLPSEEGRRDAHSKVLLLDTKIERRALLSSARGRKA